MDGSGEANPYIDSSVGALVWVRRRNGSWWPGRILGPEELPGSHLLSPRTGTPVKLLGREDGSVDWYNIEKSRRVKAFRCGDFDECIEKAKSLASVLTKKREKYARREDAILHALELEKKHIHQNYSFESRLSLGRGYREISNFVDDDMVLDDDMEGIANHSDFQSDFMDPESSADAAQASLDSLFSLQGEKKFLDADWEDEIAETIPRMRGLQDLGMKIVSSKEQKASRSTTNEHAVDVSLPEEEHKLASCITKSAATLPCTAAAISKRKRFSQTGWAEDESAYKKPEWQMPLRQGLDNGVKFEDGASDLGSKTQLASFFAGTSRNGFGLLAPKQEKNSAIVGNNFQGRSELKPSTTGSGAELWQDEAKLHDSSLLIDKACSSFSDKINCCDGHSYPYAGSQMGVSSWTGPPFVDSYIPGGPPLRCSFLPRPGYAASAADLNDNGIQTVSSFGLAGKFAAPLANFHMWPNYGHRESVLPNEYGLPGQIASGRAVGLPDYSFDSTILSPMYPLYSNPLESSSNFARSGALEKEGSLLLPRNLTNVDVIKPPVKPCKQCLSTGEEGERRSRAREDEANSLQLNQELSTCPFKEDGAYGDEGGNMKQAEGFQAAIRHNYLKSAVNTHGFTRTDELLDETGLNYMSSPSNQCSDQDIQQTWQAKGKRRSRVPCRNNWLSSAADAMANMTPANPLVDEYEGVLEANTSDVKVKNRTTRERKYSFDFDSLYEVEEPLKDSGRSRQQLARKRRVCFESSDGTVEVHHGCAWFEVPVEDQITAVLQGEYVELVSIMSKLKGQPIVGHPVLVERIDRRYGGSQNGGSRVSSCGFDAIKPPLQPVWRTARRTAMQRVPRSCGIAISRDYALKRQHQHCSTQNRLMKKNGSVLRSFADRKKTPKRSVPLPQKTRMLSSISVQDIDKAVEPAASKVMVPPVATCIPVNVIFNRIREVLYRGANYAASDSDIS